MIPLKVMTYNIHKGFSAGNLSFNLSTMKDEIKKHDPDILFIQEIVGQNDKKEKKIENWPLNGHHEFLASGVWDHYTYGQHATYQYGHHGNAILSKFPLESIEHLTLTKFKRASRGLISATIDLGLESPVHLICAHLGMLKKNRNDQLELLIEKISNSVKKDDYLILAGDFNDWREEDTEDLQKTFNLTESSKQITGSYSKTYPALRPMLCNDRIYTRGFEIQASNCLSEAPWNNLSDHLPLLATIY